MQPCGPCGGNGPVAPGSCPTRSKFRMNWGLEGLLRSKTCVTRFTRQPGTAETRYAMPVEHSHSFLCVAVNGPETAIGVLGAAGFVTSYSSCDVDVARSIHT